MGALCVSAKISVSGRCDRPLSAGRNARRSLLEERADAGAGHLHRRTAGGAVPAAERALSSRRFSRFVKFAIGKIRRASVALRASSHFPLTEIKAGPGMVQMDV